MGRSLLQSDRNATLFIEVLRSYVAAKKFWVHDFVIMPDHIHIILTVGPDMTVEKAVQFIKGGFSYRLKKEPDTPGRYGSEGSPRPGLLMTAAWNSIGCTLPKIPSKRD